jgi:hypothetical protein
MQVAKVPATNSKGLSLIRFEGFEDVSGTKENERGTYEYSFTKLLFTAMDKQKKYSVKVDVVGKYGATKDTRLTETIVAMGYQEETTVDLDNLTDVDEADDFAEGTDEITGEIQDTTAQHLELFLSSCKDLRYWARLKVNERGRYTLEPDTLVPFEVK